MACRLPKTRGHHCIDKSASLTLNPSKLRPRTCCLMAKRCLWSTSSDPVDCLMAGWREYYARAVPASMSTFFLGMELAYQLVRHRTFRLRLKNTTYLYPLFPFGPLVRSWHWRQGWDDRACTVVPCARTNGEASDNLARSQGREMGLQLDKTCRFRAQSRARASISTYLVSQAMQEEMYGY